MATDRQAPAPPLSAVAVALEAMPEHAHRGPKAQPALSEGEALELLVMLYENPVLGSPVVFPTKKRAEWRGQRIQQEIERYGVPVRLSVYRDPDQGGWLWLLRREDGKG